MIIEFRPPWRAHLSDGPLPEPCPPQPRRPLSGQVWRLIWVVTWAAVLGLFLVLLHVVGLIGATRAAVETVASPAYAVPAASPTTPAAMVTAPTPTITITAPTPVQTVTTSAVTSTHQAGDPVVDNSAQDPTPSTPWWASLLEWLGKPFQWLADLLKGAGQ